MIKRSSKVLSMVMAFSMAASVFVAPNAFAAWSETDPIKAKVTTKIIEKNANDVYELKGAATGSNSVTVATVTYNNGTVTDQAALSATGSFNVGETYDVTITQDSTQAKGYEIKGAKLSVKLEDTDSAYYDEYVEDIDLVKSVKNNTTTYAGNFTPFTSATAALKSTHDVADLNLYIEVETKASVTVSAEAGTATNATIKPLDANREEVSSITLEDGKDAYFKITPSNEYYIDADNISVTAWNKSETQITNLTGADTGTSISTLKLESVIDGSGINTYKLSGADVTKLRAAVGNGGKIKINYSSTTKAANSYTIALAEDLKGDYSIVYPDGTAYNGERVLRGTEMKVKSADSGDNISSVTFANDEKAQTYCSNSDTASFIVPKLSTGTTLTISGINFSDNTADAKLKLSDDKASVMSINSGSEVAAKSGSTQKVVFSSNSRTYPNYVLSDDYAIGYDSNGWKFDFLGVEDGKLTYNVTFGTGEVDDTTVTSIKAPSVTNKFIPVVKFNQELDNGGHADIKLEGITSGSVTSGLVSLDQNTTIKVGYNSSVLNMDYINLAGTKLTTSGTSKIDTTTTTNAATATIKVTKDNKKNSVLDFDADYKKGNIDITEVDNGTVVAKAGLSSTSSIRRAKAGSTVYLLATPKTGYKLDSITVKNAVTTQKAVSVWQTESNNIYGMTMPNVNVDNDYGDSVVVTASFVKDSSLVKVNNLVEYTDKAENNGYAKTSLGADSQATVGKEFTVKYVANSGNVILATSVKYKNTKGETVILEATEVNNNEYTYKTPDDVSSDSSLEISAIFGPEKAKVEVNAAEKDKDTNNGYVKVENTEVAAGGEIKGTVSANKDCKLISLKYSYKNLEGETVTEAVTVEKDAFKITAPKGIDTNTAISIIARFVKTSEIIKVENKAAEADKKTNNGYLTIDATEVLAKDVINGTVTAVEGYEVESVSYSYTNSDKKTVTKDVTVTENAFAITVPDDVVADGTISVSAKFAKSETADSDKKAWVKEDDKWTYWKDGKKVTGWLQDGGVDWFYCDPETGLMRTGWFQDGGDDWFYADVNTGAMKTGWFKDGGSTWYYSFTQEDAAVRGNRAGVMATNQWVLNNNKWYYLGKDGAMVTNSWVRDNDDNVWSFVGEDGAFTGEQKSSI